MTIPDRGSKHVCPSCRIKYYDLGRQVVTCPKCGASPVVMQPPKAPKAKKAHRSNFRQMV